MHFHVWGDTHILSVSVSRVWTVPAGGAEVSVAVDVFVSVWSLSSVAVVVVVVWGFLAA